MTQTMDLGALGERLAARYLKDKGYKILAANYRLGHKEIDIIAQLGDLVVLVEVKTAASTSPVKPEEQLNSLKIRHLKRAAWLYCLEQHLNPNKLRTDLLAISLNRAEKLAKIKHFENIF